MTTKQPTISAFWIRYANGGKLSPAWTDSAQKESARRERIMRTLVEQKRS